MSGDDDLRFGDISNGSSGPKGTGLERVIQITIQLIVLIIIGYAGIQIVLALLETM